VKDDAKRVAGAEIVPGMGVGIGNEPIPKRRVHDPAKRDGHAISFPVENQKCKGRWQSARFLARTTANPGYAKIEPLINSGQGAVMKDLIHLADLIRIRNFVNASVGRSIRGPAETGRIAEFVASEIFDIELEEKFVTKAIDGKFRSPLNLKGATVNIKYRSSSSLRLNLINSDDPSDHPDFYLALRGPFVAKSPNSEKVLPFVINSVYLFSATSLIERMKAEGYMTFGPSVKKAYWDESMIYPKQVNPALVLSDEQRATLAHFAPTSSG
jgi:hypothetical protein